MDVGQQLRVARERQGLTLQQLSATTKISPRVLQAIEAGDEARLPARVFTRAFVKTYAEEVGLDPGQTVALYVAQFETEEQREAQAAQQAPAPPAPETRLAAIKFGSNVPTPVVLTMVVALIVGITAWQRHAGHALPTRTSAQAAAGLTPAPQPQEKPVGTTGSTPAPADGPLKFAIAASGPCWIRATVGDQQVLGTLLNTGEKRAFDVPSDVTLRVGDPATFSYTINGKPGRSVGPAHQPVTVRITRENYQQYLAGDTRNISPAQAHER